MRCSKCDCEIVSAGRLCEDEMGFFAEVNGREVYLPNVMGQPDVALCPKCGTVRLFQESPVAEFDLLDAAMQRPE